MEDISGRIYTDEELLKKWHKENPNAEVAFSPTGHKPKPPELWYSGRYANCAKDRWDFPRSADNRGRQYNCRGYQILEHKIVDPPIGIILTEDLYMKPTPDGTSFLCYRCLIEIMDFLSHPEKMKKGIMGSDGIVY